MEAGHSQGVLNITLKDLIKRGLCLHQLNMPSQGEIISTLYMLLVLVKLRKPLIISPWPGARTTNPYME